MLYEFPEWSHDPFPSLPFHSGLETNQVPIKLASLLDSITDIYSSLAKAIECVSMALGPAILMGMLSSLLHLVATAYFLLVELVTKGFNPFTLVQFAWIIIHTTRLILLVEPCHRAYYETQLTSDIISDGIRRPASAEIKERVSFWWTSKDFVSVQQLFTSTFQHTLFVSWKCSGGNFWFSGHTSTLAECAKSIGIFWHRYVHMTLLAEEEEEEDWMHEVCPKSISIFHYHSFLVLCDHRHIFGHPAAISKDRWLIGIYGDFRTCSTQFVGGINYKYLCLIVNNNNDHRRYNLTRVWRPFCRPWPNEELSSRPWMSSPPGSTGHIVMLNWVLL